MIQHPDYIVKYEIGRGGMATVYLAYDKVFKCDVAIKILNKEFLYNEHVKNRFLDEARKIYRMNHTNIIRVTRIIEEKENVGFVMEYFDAITLKDVIEQQGKLAEDHIIRLMVQMLDALKYVHQQGLVHRDVKPSNFMVDRNGVLKLLDFGIAKNSDPQSAEYTQTAASYQMGTPMYMSPEQINESRNVSAQSDIYSLGVVLWYMVMGERPYDSGSLSTFQLLSKIVNEQLKDTQTVFQPIIAKCTAKDLLVRYADCDQIKAALLCIDPKVQTQPLLGSLFERPVTMPKSGPTESTRIVDFEKADKKQPTPGFFNKRVILIVSSAVILLIATIGILLLTQQKEGKQDVVAEPKSVPVSNDSAQSASDTAPIVIDSTGLIPDPVTMPKKTVAQPQNPNQPKTTAPKKITTVSHPKTVATPTNQPVVSPPTQVVTPPTNNTPASDPVTKDPTNEPAPKETKLKKSWNKIKEKVNDTFKKKDKQ